MHDLVSHHIFDGLTGGFQILAGIKVIRMLREVFADIAGHSQTDIGVDIDLTYCKLSCLTKLLFRNTYCIGHIAAVLVNHLNKFLRNRRGTVKNNRESRKTLNALL